jgi:hypothetical protein
MLVTEEIDGLSTHRRYRNRVSPFAVIRPEFHGDVDEDYECCQRDQEEENAADKVCLQRFTSTLVISPLRWPRGRFIHVLESERARKTLGRVDPIAWGACGVCDILGTKGEKHL